MWAPHVNGPLSPPREPWRGAADPRGRGGGGTDGRAHDEDTQPAGDLHQTPQVEEIPDVSDMVTLYGAPELLYRSFYFDSNRLEHIHALAIANNDNENLLSGAPHLRHCLGFGPCVGATDEATVHHGQATLPLPRGVLRYEYMRSAVDYFNVMRAWPSLASTLLIMMWS
uniref:Uncharacterized protein n=1 Tax=Oryza nivara TaxID=4536 RepID=A0A0E0GNS1_ORYNI